MCEKADFFFIVTLPSEVDQASGFVTKTILCMPIKNGREEIIGMNLQ